MRVSRPAREKKRRRRVLVVTDCFPRPMRAAQRARLCTITWTASQAALAAVNGGDKVGRVGGRLLSIGDLIVYRLPSFIGL